MHIMFQMEVEVKKHECEDETENKNNIPAKTTLNEYIYYLSCTFACIDLIGRHQGPDLTHTNISS